MELKKTTDYGEILPGIDISITTQIKEEVPTMPFGDIGGIAAQLIITCEADCQIKKGDPVTLLENYHVRNYLGDLFGQAMHDAENGQSLPVLVRGVARFDSDRFDPPRGRNKWRISSNGPSLVSMGLGSELTILYQSDERLDVLL